MSSGPPRPKGEPEVVELTKPQRAVVRLMTQSKTTMPHFYVSAEVDMTAAVELRERLTAAGDPAPTFTDMIVKACGIALRESPRVNASFRDDHVEIYPRVNVAVAVAAADAVFTPTIRDADTAPLAEIARVNRELTGKVRNGTVSPPELDGGTFTVSNLGMFGVDAFVAVITPPQAASVAVGRLAARPVVDETGGIVVRQMVTLTLSCDHRVVMGAQAALFLDRVRNLLEQPDALTQ